MSLIKGLLSISLITLRITFNLGKIIIIKGGESKPLKKKCLILSLEYVPENVSEVAKIGQILASIQAVSRKESF